MNIPPESFVVKEIGTDYALGKASSERGSSLRNAYIKFQTPEDCALGCNTLAAHSYVSRLTGDIFCIPWKSLELLDSHNVAYSLATEDDLTNAHPVWNFAVPAH